MLLNKKKIIKNPFLFLIGIFFIGLSYRLYNFEIDIPVIMDSYNFFTYAADISTLGQLPVNYDVAKPGWSYFLALFFSIFDFESTIQYMELQKKLGLIISSLTIFPLYYLIRRFVDSKYSFVGVLLFVADPRILENSLEGNSEPLFIFLLTSCLFLFFQHNTKLVYLSFFMAGLASIVRPEGLFLFSGMLVSYIILFRKKNRLVFRCMLVVIIFVLILIPVILHKQQDGMYGFIFERVIVTIQDTCDAERCISDSDIKQQSSAIEQIFISLEIFGKYLIWILIPLFIILVPIGIFIIFKELDSRKLSLIILTIFMTIPAFYAYSFPFLEIKYLFFLFPMFSVFSAVALHRLFNDFKQQKIILTLAFFLIIFGSGVFLEIQSEKKEIGEIIIVSNYIIDNTKVINNFYPESRFIHPLSMNQEWSEYTKFYIETDRTLGLKGDEKTKQIYHEPVIKIIEPKKFDSLDAFLEHADQERISHLVLDGKSERPDFLNDIFYDKVEYSFIKKIYDTKDEGLEYHVKIYEIDYNIFLRSVSLSDDTYIEHRR